MDDKQSDKDQTYFNPDSKELETLDRKISENYCHSLQTATMKLQEPRTILVQGTTKVNSVVVAIVSLARNNKTALPQDQ